MEARIEQRIPAATENSAPIIANPARRLSALPFVQVPSGLEGFSLVPLLHNPTTPWKTAAFSQYPRGLPKGTKRDAPGDHAMGYTVRTAQWRYTEWVYFHNKTYTMDWSRNFGTELYSHLNDSGTSMTEWENTNLAKSEEHADVVKELQKLLHAGPNSARPASR